MTTRTSPTRQHRIICALVLALAGSAVAVLLALHDGTPTDTAAWLGVLVAASAAATAQRGGCRRAARAAAAARR